MNYHEHAPAAPERSEYKWARVLTEGCLSEQCLAAARSSVAEVEHVEHGRSVVPGASGVPARVVVRPAQDLLHYGEKGNVTAAEH